MNQNTPSPEVNPDQLLFIGVGGAGCSLIEYLKALGLGEGKLAAMHTDSRALSRCTVSHQVLLGQKHLRGLSSGGDVDLGRRSAQLQTDDINALLQGRRVVFILAGLGRGTGTGAAPVVAKLARDAGATVIGLAILPFGCEGQTRRTQAAEGLQQLSRSCDALFCILNEEAADLAGRDVPLSKAMYTLNVFASRALAGLSRLTEGNGLVPVTLGDVVAACRHQEGLGLFGYAETESEGGIDRLWESIRKHPCLGRSEIWRGSRRFLVHLTGGEALTLGQIQRLQSKLTAEVPEGNWVVGASHEPRLEGRLAMTICALGVRVEEWGVEAEPAAATDAPEAGVEETFGNTDILSAQPGQRSAFRYVAPAPVWSQEKKEEQFRKQRGRAAGLKSAAIKLKQGFLPLEAISRGRFDKSEPTIHAGEDLDVPTYVRRGLALN